MAQADRLSAVQFPTRPSEPFGRTLPLKSRMVSAPERSLFAGRLEGILETEGRPLKDSWLGRGRRDHFTKALSQHAVSTQFRRLRG